MSKPLDLDTIKARLAAACPGPWKGFTFRRPIDGNCYIIVREDDPRVIAATLLPAYSDPDTVPLLLHARADIEALIAEVERLRAEIARTEQIVADNAHWFRTQERERIVAWLRERQPGWPAGWGGHADAIERGEHRREEEP